MGPAQCPIEGRGFTAVIGRGFTAVIDSGTLSPVLREAQRVGEEAP